MTATSYQSVSGTGQTGIDVLAHEIDVLGKDHELLAKGGWSEPGSDVYSRPIGFNVLAHAGGFTEQGYTDEEWKLVNETRKILKEAVELEEASVVISEAPCVLLPELKERKPVSYFTNQENCVGCTSCIRLGCPAISWTGFAEGEAKQRGYRSTQKGISKIDEILCNDCGQCASLCKFNAITRGEG